MRVCDYVCGYCFVVSLASGLAQLRGCYSQLLKSLRFVRGSARPSGEALLWGRCVSVCTWGKGFQDDDLRCLFPAGPRP